jgi:hypothetical protein
MAKSNTTSPTKDLFASLNLTNITLHKYNKYNDPVARRRENLVPRLTDQRGLVLDRSYQRVANLKEDLPGVADRLVILTNEGGFDAQLKAFAEAAAASLASSDFLARQLRDSPPKRWGSIPRVFFSLSNNL